MIKFATYIDLMKINLLVQIKSGLLFRNGSGSMNPAGKLLYLDGWRGLAVALLLVGHFFPTPGINLGNFGVNLFFVLSGLLMTKILVTDGIAIPVFYRRRISRIFPAFLFYLFVMTLVFFYFQQDVKWREFFSAITFTKNYFPSDGADQMPFGHIWSLSVEEHSYIVLSGLAVLARIKRLKITTSLVLVVGAMLATCLFYYVTAPASQGYFLTHRSEIAALPIFAAGLFLLFPSTANRFDWMVVPLAFTLAVIVQWWSIPYPVRIIVGSLALAICVGALGKADKWTLAVLSCKPLRLLGLWSYSIYLWQQPFYLLQEKGLNSVLGVVLGILCGVASFYFIEAPARSYLNASWGNKPSGASGKSVVDSTFIRTGNGVSPPITSTSE